MFYALSIAALLQGLLLCGWICVRSKRAAMYGRTDNFGCSSLSVLVRTLKFGFHLQHAGKVVMRDHLVMAKNPR